MKTRAHPKDRPVMTDQPFSLDSGFVFFFGGFWFVIGDC